MPDESVRKASRTLGKLTLQMHRKKREVMSPSQTYRLRDAVAPVLLARGETNLNDALNAIMMMAMAGIEDELIALAQQLQGGLENRQGLREAISKLQEAITNPNAVYPIEIRYSYTLVEDGEYVHKAETVRVKNREEAIELLESLEALLTAEFEITATMLLDLQSRQQEFAQITQTSGALTRQWHDEVKSIIENIRR